MRTKVVDSYQEKKGLKEKQRQMKRHNESFTTPLKKRE